MATELVVYTENNAELDSLRDWLGNLSDTEVSVRTSAPAKGHQAGGWDFLIVSCGTGGAVTVALGSLKVWLESRVTTVRVKAGESELELRSGNLDEDMPHLLRAVRALRVR